MSAVQPTPALPAAVSPAPTAITSAPTTSATLGVRGLVPATSAGVPLILSSSYSPIPTLPAIVSTVRSAPAPTAPISAAASSLTKNLLADLRQQVSCQFQLPTPFPLSSYRVWLEIPVFLTLSRLLPHVSPAAPPRFPPKRRPLLLRHRLRLPPCWHRLGLPLPSPGSQPSSSRCRYEPQPRSRPTWSRRPATSPRP